MLVDIFSSFDEQNLNLFSFSFFIWGVSFFLVFFVGAVFWWLPSRWVVFLSLPVSFMYSQVLRGYGKNLGGFSILVVCLFVLLLGLNLLGLVPYVFGVTGHLVFAFSFAIPFWLGLILSGMFFKFDVFCAGLLPAGAPIALNPFLILIETVSILVRPITLSVRLVANMGAGHIVIGLIGTYLSSAVFSYSWLAFFVLLFVQVFYFVFEFGVSLIQGYIFSLLLTLYADEHAH